MQEYKVNEIFYSIQGEGCFSGTPTIFIRLSGCNLKCKFCDTSWKEGVTLPLSSILEKVQEFTCWDVCITGGEPTLQDLNPLIYELNKRGCIPSLETNGINPVPANCFITVSPKTLKCDRVTISGADQIKFLCGFKGWEEFIKAFVKKFNIKTRLYTDKYFLQPIWDKKKGDKETVKIATDYVMQNPWLRLGVQLHKHLNLK